MLSEPAVVLTRSARSRPEGVLTAVASTVEGRRGGPLTEAAERFDKAARAGYAKVARGTSRSWRSYQRSNKSSRVR